MALHLNSALAQIDRKMEEETTSLLFPKSVARSSKKLLLAVGKEQSEVFYRLGELQQERDNIKVCALLYVRNEASDSFRSVFREPFLRHLESSYHSLCRDGP